MDPTSLLLLLGCLDPSSFVPFVPGENRWTLPPDLHLRLYPNMGRDGWVNGPVIMGDSVFPFFTLFDVV